MSGHTAAATLRIEPGAIRSLGLKEMWEYRELLYFLTWRDVKVRYKQTALGATWAVIQPFMTMVVFSIFFGKLAGIDSRGIPYPLFAYAALLPWTYFAQVVSGSADSVVASGRLVSKVYFPRMIIPAAGALAALVDLAVSFLVYVVLVMSYHLYEPAGYDFQVTAGLLLLPVFLLLAVTTALGVGLWLAALNVRYRDVRYVVPFLVQFWLFATPVIYPGDLLQGVWRWIYSVNPMVAVVEGFRWALLGQAPPGPGTALSVAVGLGLLISGAYYFRSLERGFADLV